MAMRLADTFLVHLRSCFAILFSGQTLHWSLPRFLITQLSLHCPEDRTYGYRTNVCKCCVQQAQTRALAVKYPCDAFRARAADDSIGGPQMLKFLNVLAALAAVGSFVIAFLDSYEVRFKSVGARAVRTVEGICAATSANKNARGSDPGHLTKAEKLGRPRSQTFTRGASFSIEIVSRIAPPIRDILKTQMRA